ncbi:hypothetical protein DSM112329_03313 [Paraconexibacter sp. AEG42_29]|uniref:Uncharacterized protein n=1 Tax=Paraconexibacter sp. AEG42_29 TaxID=2997339 RepID=A0AAU7AXQ5_9ACTN
MSIGISHDHRHRHLHNERAHGGSCTCRGCGYDGSVGDLLVLRNAVERIGSGADDRTGSAAEPGREPSAPAGTPARTIERLRDELDNYAYHRGGTVNVYA